MKDSLHINCVIALGSNLQNPMQQVQQALVHMAALPNTSILKVSRWYQSEAIGPGQQADYINGACQISTLLKPLDLLQQLQTIENTQQRVRSVRWGARTLDLDILLYGEQIIDEADLVVPHPRMLERNFVLYPLYDLNPDLVLPNGLSLRHCKEKLNSEGLRLVDDSSSPTMPPMQN
jgi:2-amino-4-hydroxy-6-hydroxymethyldihydropteridine diphosphokinase